MATFNENINNIRTAAKGTVVREAIAAAIEQSDTLIDALVDGLSEEIESIDPTIVASASVAAIDTDNYQLIITPNS